MLKDLVLNVKGANYAQCNSYAIQNAYKDMKNLITHAIKN